MRKSTVILVTLCVSVFVVGTSEYLIAGLLSQVADDLDVSVSAAGQTVTAYGLGVVIGGPLVTLLTARRPRKGLALSLMLVFAAGSAISALAPTYEILLLGRIVSSLSHAAFFALSLVVASRVVPPDRVGKATAAVVSGLTVATLLGVPLGALLGERTHWRTPFVVLTALSLVGTAMLALWLPRQEGESAGARAEIRVMAQRTVLLAIATTAVGFAGVATVFTYVAPLLTDITGFAAFVVSILLLAYGAGSFLGNIIAGRLTDRAPAATLRGVFAALAILLACTPFAITWKPTAVLAILLLGLLATATIAPLQGLILRHAAEAPTLAVSVNVGAFQLATALGSVVGGVIVAADGLRWTGLAGAVLSGLGLLISCYALPLRAQHRANEPGAADTEETAPLSAAPSPASPA
ncbi:MFS transporter [Streptomyces sp. PT12]|uniref:MFS transporter n=1 Tax=Streptomyces sp. PT12 TaxID=1510197 RepID=UPI000DE3D579|nr:MFS transporter [Streptomyces sp. PT12]RBM06232.1 MFS transporter [Streptomyces sp. PT12]